jgi:signal transduction histidine kinase
MLISGHRIQQGLDDLPMTLLAIRDVTDARQQEGRLRMIQEMQAVKGERDRLSHRLHDHIQQLLYAAGLHVTIVQMNEPSEENSETLKKVETLLQEAGQAARDLAVELTPPVLLDAGLITALQWLADWVHDKYKLRLHLEVEQDVHLEDEAICLLLFDATRELLLNIIKHAEVDSAVIQAARIEQEWLQIVVKDEGAGYRPDRVEQKTGMAVGFGLSSIERRIESVGGSVQVQTAEGQGTSTTIMIPLRRR